MTIMYKWIMAEEWKSGTLTDGILTDTDGKQWKAYLSGDKRILYVGNTTVIGCNWRAA